MNGVRASVTKMEDFFSRFPHLSDKIFANIDHASIEECRLVSKSWKSYLDHSKHIQIRLIQKNVDSFCCVEESWKDILKKSNSDIIEELFCAVKELYGAKPKNQHCHLGKSPVNLEGSCDQKTLKTHHFTIFLFIHMLLNFSNVFISNVD